MPGVGCGQPLCAVLTYPCRATWDILTSHNKSVEKRGKSSPAFQNPYELLVKVKKKKKNWLTRCAWCGLWTAFVCCSHLSICLSGTWPANIVASSFLLRMLNWHYLPRFSKSTELHISRHTHVSMHRHGAEAASYVPKPPYTQVYTHTPTTVRA